MNIIVEELYVQCFKNKLIIIGDAFILEYNLQNLEFMVNNFYNLLTSFITN